MLPIISSMMPTMALTGLGTLTGAVRPLDVRQAPGFFGGLSSWSLSTEQAYVGSVATFGPFQRFMAGSLWGVTRADNIPQQALAGEPAARAVVNSMGAIGRLVSTWSGDMQRLRGDWGAAMPARAAAPQHKAEPEVDPALRDPRERAARYFDHVVVNEQSSPGKILPKETSRALGKEEKDDARVTGREKSLQWLASQPRWIHGKAILGQKFLATDKALRDKGELTAKQKLIQLMTPGQEEMTAAAARKVQGVLASDRSPSSDAVDAYLDTLIEQLEDQFGDGNWQEIVADLYQYTQSYLQDEMGLKPYSGASTASIQDDLKEKGYSEADAAVIADKVFAKLKASESPAVVEKRLEEFAKLNEDRFKQERGIGNKAKMRHDFIRVQILKAMGIEDEKEQQAIYGMAVSFKGTGRKRRVNLEVDLSIFIDRAWEAIALKQGQYDEKGNEVQGFGKQWKALSTKLRTADRAL